MKIHSANRFLYLKLKLALIFHCLLLLLLHSTQYTPSLHHIKNVENQGNKIEEEERNSKFGRIDVRSPLNVWFHYYHVSFSRKNDFGVARNCELDIENDFELRILNINLV